MPTTRRSRPPAGDAAATPLPIAVPRPWLAIDGAAPPGLQGAIAALRLDGALNQPARA